MIRTLLALLPPRSGRSVVAYLLLSVLGIVLRALGVVLLVPLVAALFGDTATHAWPWLGLLALVTVCGWFVDALAARRAFRLGFGLLDSGQRTVADRLSEIRLHWFDADRSAVGRQAVAATGPDLVGIIIYLVTPVLSAVFLPIAISIALLPISVPLGVAGLAGVPLLGLAFWLSGRLSRGADRVAADANTELTERIVEFARTQPALRAARRVDAERGLVSTALRNQHTATIRLLLLQIPGQLIFGIASQLALLLLAGTAVVLALRGEIAAPEAIAFVVVIVRYLEPFTMLAELSPGVETAVGVLRRIREVLDAPVDLGGTEARSGVGAPRIELSGIRFGYAGEADAQPVLQEFDLTFEPGSTTAIVGPSGSGKSTVLALIAGLRRPDVGQILIDGVDADRLTLEARRESVSMVFQHPYLFDGSVRENVLAGNPSADDAALERAAELARVDVLLERLPDGWESRVGEAGSALSGGERQRVSIARALVKPAPVLLVDEATSALDAENEAAVAAALSGDPLPRTRVIVAHRLSSIRAADRVVFVEEGRIVESGTLEELTAAGGRFADFAAQQHAASAWRVGRDPQDERKAADAPPSTAL